MVWARTSLPTPVSPSTRMLSGLAARSRTTVPTAAAVGSTTRSDSARADPDACDLRPRARATTKCRRPIWNVSPTASATCCPCSRRAPRSRVPLRDPRSSTVIVARGGVARGGATARCSRARRRNRAARPIVISSRRSGNVMRPSPPATSKSPSPRATVVSGCAEGGGLRGITGHHQDRSAARPLPARPRVDRLPRRSD